MLTYLHVKNLALIEETEIEFGTGLNIMTGETGAGKSILMGSVNLALGGKAGNDVIGKHGESALVELGFFITNPDTIASLNEMDIYPEDGRIFITRRIMPGHSVIKINGETVTASLVKKITTNLIDIHGQHDHQSLLYKANHLEILDQYARMELNPLKIKLEQEYRLYLEYKKEGESFTLTEEERTRNISFLNYEIQEIEEAHLLPEEDVEIEAEYRRIINAKKITDQLDQVRRLVGGDTMGDASDQISKAFQSLAGVVKYDQAMEPLESQLRDIENLLGDFNYELKTYSQSLQFDDSRYWEVEKRMDLINNLKSKYGSSLEQIQNYLEDAQMKLDFYHDYETRYQAILQKVEEQKRVVTSLCQEISEHRKAAAIRLSTEIMSSLQDLNFGQVQFEIAFSRTKEPGKNGFDEAEFMICVNPGESIKPLAKIASGGELSRIMLGIKSVLAGRDEIDTLIFDEIDTGISGRTAQKVSEKMAEIAKSHQLICITHLPQIAAMADTHFLIEKNMDLSSTKTLIKGLEEQEMIQELARMLGGLEITEIVLENARQMKTLASNQKNNSKR